MTNELNIESECPINQNQRSQWMSSLLNNFKDRGKQEAQWSKKRSGKLRQLPRSPPFHVRYAALAQKRWGPSQGLWGALLSGRPFYDTSPFYSRDCLAYTEFSSVSGLRDPRFYLVQRYPIRQINSIKGILISYVPLSRYPFFLFTWEYRYQEISLVQLFYGSSPL